MLVNPNGSFAYDPRGAFDELIAGQSAMDTFRYTVSDGEGGADTATVTITVLGNNGPVARDDAYVTGENTNLVVGPSIGLLANDTDPDDPLTVTSMDTSRTLGSVSWWGTNGSFLYNPNRQFERLAVGETAIDTFTYTVSDGKGGSDTATVIITIEGANDAPVARMTRIRRTRTRLLSVAANTGLLANDTDPDASDVLTVSGVNTAGTLGVVTWNANGSFTYNPNGRFESLAVGQTATDTFTYTVSDGQGGTGTARVTLTIAGVNDAPVAAG